MIKTDTINRYNQVHINDKTIYCNFTVQFELKLRDKKAGKYIQR